MHACIITLARINLVSWWRRNVAWRRTVYYVKISSSVHPAGRITGASKRQAPSAKRQAPSAKRQAPSAKRQAPSAKRQSSFSAKHRKLQPEIAIFCQPSDRVHPVSKVLIFELKSSKALVRP